MRHDPLNSVGSVLHSENSRPEADDVVKQIGPDHFQNWRQASKARENIESGKAYYNDPSPVPPAQKHIPSSLLQCHRKLFYRKENAPAEEALPEGILWQGTRFEEDIVLPYLQESVSDEGLFAANSVYVDFEVTTENVALQVSGSTDPVIVDRDGVPILPTEIKTKKSVEHLTEPNEHHKAQLHAYLVGLSKKYETNLSRGVLIYGSRESLDIEIFNVEFDQAFWEQIVVEWAAKHTEYRLSSKLPPAEPRFGWECNFCAYQHRCGNSEKPFSDLSVHGFVPQTEYPKEQVVDYLEAHSEAKLTPTLAVAYPILAEAYGTTEWKCTACGEQYPFDEVDWEGHLNEPPFCRKCGQQKGIRAPLTGSVQSQESAKKAEEGDAE